MKKVSAYIDEYLTFAKVSRNCDEKYARKLLQDYLKSHTAYKGGWEATKNFDRWEDQDWYYFDIDNIFAGKPYQEYRLNDELPVLSVTIQD
jgi:hypothetical protein